MRPRPIQNADFTDPRARRWKASPAAAGFVSQVRIQKIGDLVSEKPQVFQSRNLYYTLTQSVNRLRFLGAAAGRV